jgi:hypothetical protein
MQESGRSSARLEGPDPTQTCLLRLGKADIQERGTNQPLEGTQQRS